MRDEEELCRAMDLYGDMVWRVCLLHLKNRADAEDVLQNVLLKFALRDKPFQSPQHEKAWVLRVAINESRDLLRDAFRRRSVPLSQLVEAHAPQASPEEREVLEAVLALPTKYRDPVYLYYYEGYRAAEIGKILGKKANTVYTLLQRARKLLKDRLEGDEGHG